MQPTNLQSEYMKDETTTTCCCCFIFNIERMRKLIKPKLQN